MFNVKQFDVIPLFSSPLAITRIKDDMSALDLIKSKPFNVTNDSGSEISESYSILDDFPREKNIILKHFDDYKNEVFEYRSIKFNMYSSWSTKCKSRTGSDLHNHTNSIFSAVYYLDDIAEEDGGSLAFTNIGINKTSYNIMGDRINAFNGDNFTVQPGKGVLAIFPSYMYHRIEPYFGQNSRYSIAMNFMVEGNIGYADSKLELKIV